MHNSELHRALGGMAIAAAVAMIVGPTCASAETIESAMARAYQGNPQLNAQRAQLRAVDENVPQAMSGYRPKVNVTATAGEQYTDQTVKNVIPGAPQLTTYQKQFANTQPYSVGATLTQPVFDGFQTPNRVGAAEKNVSSQREALRVLEQTVLLAAATSYMDVSRDAASLEVNRTNVRTLEELLGQTRERFNAGEVTATDVAQAESQLATGRTNASAAESQYNTSRATYRQVIGVEAGNLAPAAPVDRFSPGSLGAAIARGQEDNPNITAAEFGVDVAYLQIKVAEGALFPQLSVQANAQFANSPAIGITNSKTASAIAQLTIPIYNGGTEYSLIRQSKETLEQQRLNVDQVRNQVRQQVVQSWGQVQATKTQVESTAIGLKSAETALNGARQEAKVGQRTTFEVLQIQQQLFNARLALLVAQHDRVVASYGLLGSTGHLAPQVLGLPTPVYDATVHYKNTRDAWFGLRRNEGDKNFAVGSEDVATAPVRPVAGDGEAMQQSRMGEDAKADDGKGEVKKADGHKMTAPMSLAQAASGAPLEPTPVSMPSGRPAVRPAAGRMQMQESRGQEPRAMDRAPDLQPEDVFSPRDVRPEPGRMQPATTAPTPAAPRMRGVGLMQGALPVVATDRFTGGGGGSLGGRRPAPESAPQAVAPQAQPQPAAPAGAAARSATVPGARPMPGALPALPSDRFGGGSAQSSLTPSDTRPNSFAADPGAGGLSYGAFSKIR
jgi:outer membrane protein